ncbi:hypothetical protein F2Q69_00062225 [Brassica cretica]|uniref:Ubiquitin-like domain-containing protein n=1 Tax=Brassica cretica TaxID=69181 RepID=A0A8S9RJE0_BRACR|nr:hypothetical protein F2Q69_00062225 [Brassica cretica]
MTQFGGYDYCTERAMQYLTLEPGKVPEALKLYAEAFQAKLIDRYEDQSVQLKILNSYVIITPWASASASSDSFLELPTDLNSIRRIRQDKRFVEIDGTENKSFEEDSVVTEFGFLDLNHIWRGLFFDFVGVYTSILKPSKEVDRSCDFMGKALELFFHLLQLKMGGSRRRVMEVDAFTGAVDYFVYMDVVGYSDIMPRPQRRSVMIAQLGHNTLRTPMSAPPFPSWCTTIFFVSPEVLGIIKLTHGSICGAVYSKVLKNFELVYTVDIVLERYFQSLWDEEKDLDDLYSFVECVDSFAQMEDEEFYHKMGTREAHVYPFHDQTSRVHSRPHVYHPFHDQTSPANVQEEGPSSIEVCVPTLDGRVIIEIIVESFFGEKVASLKEKIVKVIQIPSKYLKLRGKSVGVLREDKSLADNNVEAGEILIATWRFSRWEVQIA